MINYILYPILELKGFIIASLIILVLLTLLTMGMLARKKKGLAAFRLQGIFLGRSRIDLMWMACGISQVVFVFSMILFFMPMGEAQTAALLVLCVMHGILGFSLAGILGEVVYGGLTFSALTIGNLLLDYMKETGIDFYILIVWGLLSLFLLQYSVFYFVKGLERMLQRNDRIVESEGERKEKPQKKTEG